MNDALSGILGLIVIGILIRLGAGAFDYMRIRRYFASGGETLLSASWAPFGPGWYGEKSDRIYFVSYLDEFGNEHEAYCKTSFLSGVYFTEDQIVEYADTSSEAESSVQIEELQAENRRLMEENIRLKRNKKNHEQSD